MNNLLLPNDYYDPEIFSQEMDRLFSTCWIYAGLVDDLVNDCDWITTRVGSTSVTIQRERGVLHAVHNVCSHRFAILRNQPKGSGPLKCPYHGWMFQCDGKVAAIPARPRFSDLDEKKIESLRLPAYQVATCGRFIFVKLHSGGPSLEEYCGEAWQPLREFSESLGQQLYSATKQISANWKLVVENALETYHTGCVHPETYGLDRSYRFKIRTGPTFTYYEEQISEASASKWNRIKKKFASRPFQTDDYHFYSLFPTFCLDTFHGATYAVVIYRPISTHLTEVYTRVFATRLSPPELESSPLVRAFNEFSTTNAPMIVEQDKKICENVQIGIQQADHLALLSEEEERIYAFHKSYKDALEK